MNKFVLLVSLGLLVGCSVLGGGLVDRVVVLKEEERLLVLPFAEAGLTHLRSGPGVDLARGVTRRLQSAEVEFKLVDFAVLREKLRYQDPDEFTPLQLAGEAQADVLATGQIKVLKAGERGDIGVFRGSIEIDVVVTRVKGAQILYQRTVSAKYPEEEGADFGVPVGEDMTEERIREALIARAAEEIAVLFYDHEPRKKR